MGGPTLQLVGDVFQFVMKSAKSYKDLFQSLSTFLSRDIEKTKIMNECVQRSDDISAMFEGIRRGSKISQAAPTILEVAIDLRKKKKMYIFSTLEDDIDVELLCVRKPTDAPNAASGPFVTPVKSRPAGTALAVRSNLQMRKDLYKELSLPLMTQSSLSEGELQEAKLVREELKKEVEEEKQNLWREASKEKENQKLEALFEVAFRAILCSNEQRLEDYREQLHGGNGDINWDIDIRDPQTNNRVLLTLKSSLSSTITQGGRAGANDPRALADAFSEEHAKYAWFVRTFLDNTAAAAAGRELEEAMGHNLEIRLLAGSEIDKMYVSMASENASVMDRSISLFAFYKAKFSKLRAGSVAAGLDPAQAPTKNRVNHIEGIDTTDMPVDVQKCYNNVFLQRPISGHPDGTPVSETQTQTESRTIESVWKMREAADKLLGWSEKQAKRKKESSDQDVSSADESDAKEAKSAEGKKKTKGGGKKTKDPTVRKLEERLQKLEKRGPGGAQNQGNQGEAKVCYQFQRRGNCDRNNCTFSHTTGANAMNRGVPNNGPARGFQQRQQPLAQQQQNPQRQGQQQFYAPQQQQQHQFYAPQQQQQNPQRQGQQYQPQGYGQAPRGPHFAAGRGLRLPDPPANACADLVRMGKCEKNVCPAFHGKWDRDSRSQCRHEQEGKGCGFLWTANGCNKAHFLTKN